MGSRGKLKSSSLITLTYYIISGILWLARLAMSQDVRSDASVAYILKACDLITPNLRRVREAMDEEIGGF